jgi:hypothetical protein
VVTGRSLVNDRAICPNAAFPDKEIQERVPETENIHTFRLSLNLLGDGFIEAVADQTLIDLSKQQCKSSRGKICGQILYVPIVEAPGQMGAGRFGWKDQYASLLSFAGDAYLMSKKPNSVSAVLTSFVKSFMTYPPALLILDFVSVPGREFSCGSGRC